MSVTIVEHHDSRSKTRGSSASMRKTYIIRGTSDEDAALDALDATAPTLIGGLVRQARRVEPVAIDTANADACIWSGEAEYGTWSITARATNSSEFSFDTGGGTQHITNGVAHSASFVLAGFAAADHKGAIGVTKDGIEGVDIDVPVFNFTVSIIKPLADLTWTYIQTLYGLTGKVNSDAWTPTIGGVAHSYAAGEVLFRGATGAVRDDSTVEVSLRFSASPNVTGRTIGDITGIAKKGWEYLWIEYEDGESNGRAVKKPFQVNVEQVYQAAAFSAFGL